jgi:hypothetical protein
VLARSTAAWWTVPLQPLLRSSTWRMAGGRLVRALAGTGTARTAGYSSTQIASGTRATFDARCKGWAAALLAVCTHTPGRWVRTYVPKALSQPGHGTAQRSARALSPEVSALEVFTSARQRLSLVVPSSVRHQHQVSVSDDGRRLTHTRTPLGSHSHSVRLPMDSAVQRLLARLMVALE